ncbi:MAG TPA: hypothetical protein VGJ03_15460 [Acidimicrobiales bacterium]
MTDQGAADDDGTLDDVDRRRIRTGVRMLAAVTLAAGVLAVWVSEPIIRFVFVGIFVIGMFQTWRVRRLLRSSPS